MSISFTEEQLLDVLNISFYSRDLKQQITIQDYLTRLLYTLWYEEEGFSGKRPFGNSCWQYEVYTALIEAKLIPGELDDDGYIETFDHTYARSFMCEVINAMGRLKP